jgi:anti-sigma factor RsiW
VTPPAPHPGDELQLLLEGLLPDDRRAAVESHLAGCERCRDELAALRWTRAAVQPPAAEAELPPALAARITAALDREDAAARRRTRLTWLVPVSLAAAAVLALLLLRKPEVNFVDVAARDFAAWRGGSLTLELVTPQPQQLAAFFAERLPDVPARVFDFGMMGYTLAGGRVHRVNGRDATFFAYRNAAGTDVVCVMYAGTLAELPEGAEEREHDGIRFRIYRAGGATLVFWEEGDVVCVLVSSGDREEAIQFAYAKAVKVS